FVHQVPRSNLSEFPDLDRLFELSAWQESIGQCRGLFTLSTYLKDYICERFPRIPVARLDYPVESPQRCFSFETYSSSSPKQLLSVGIYMRDFAAFRGVRAKGFRKILLKCEESDQFPVFSEDTGIITFDRV